MQQGWSTVFYEAIGWTPKEHLPGVRFYQINGLVLGLFGMDNLAKDQERPDVRLGVTLGQKFSTEAEVDAAFSRAISAGATILAIMRTRAVTFGRSQ